MSSWFPDVDNEAVLRRRGPKQPVDPTRPYAWLVEAERSARGVIEDVSTLFLTNRECPFRCVFCDLWRQTLDGPTPIGAVPEQIRWGLSQLPAAPHIKLYNSGNFFDPLAIPPVDYPAIAELVAPFETVIVENHPRLLNQHIIAFRDLISAQLEVALGLETVDPDILPRLNKRLTIDDFRSAAEWLRTRDVDVRTFVMLKLPGQSEDSAVDWAVRSIELAFDCGAHCCSVIAARAGNGLLDEWQQQGWFHPPRLQSLYEVLVQGLAIAGGKDAGIPRVFVDLWDAERLATCPACAPRQIAALRRMNLHQMVEPWPTCGCE
jgi:archaeosine synthase beta-subunit